MRTVVIIEEALLTALSGKYNQKLVINSLNSAIRFATVAWDFVAVVQIHLKAGVSQLGYGSSPSWHRAW